MESSWQRALAGAVRDPAQLLAELGLDEGLLPPPGGDAAAFPLLVPRGFLARMVPGDPNDPLLLQVLPGIRENEEVTGYVSDPLAEQGGQPAPGVLRKYRGRALLVVTGACAVHCRYCFRRHFPYGQANATREDWGPALEALGADPGIEEVILSGGDPLLLSDDRLARLSARLEVLPHIKRLRIHSRLPIVLPERVDEGLLAWLRGLKLPVVLVVHANHPREIDPAVGEALVRLRTAGATLLNQSVLLAGVNDDADVLAALSTLLFEYGVLPYYLHMPDQVRGTAHFAVNTAHARRIQAGLRTRLPGYLVPQVVREVPGAPFKIPLE